MTRKRSMKPSEVFRGRVREVRQRLGLSQEDLAELVGLHGTAITRIEIGKRDVKLDEVIAIAAALDVSPLHLFTPIDSDEAPIEVRPGVTVKTKLVRRWVRGTHPLDPDNVKSYSYESPGDVLAHGAPINLVEALRELGVATEERPVSREEDR